LSAEPAQQSGRKPRITLLYAADAGRERKGDLHLVGNNDLRHLLDLGQYELKALILRKDREQEALAHDFSNCDLVINAISDADLNPEGLALADAVCARLAVPVINPPALIRRITRDKVAEGLQGIPDLTVPRTCRLMGREINRRAVETAGLQWPLLLRPAGQHGGIGLMHLEKPAALDGLSLEPEAAYYLSEFVDFADRQGLYWKARVVMIGGRVHLRHCIPSPEWLVNASSRARFGDHRPELRRREGQILLDPARYLGGSALEALRQLNEWHRLDYCGMDCARLPEGRLLVFELNPAMNMLPLTASQGEAAAGALRGIIASLSALIASKLHGAERPVTG
jgi:hypothetical protein